MTHNPVRSYSAVGMPRSAYRLRDEASPWVCCDPVFEDECCAAVRAFRLICLAMFALLVTPLRGQEITGGRAGESPAAPMRDCKQESSDADEKQTRQAARVIGSAVRSAVLKITESGRAWRAVNDPKREALWLRVKRSHGPPLSYPPSESFSTPGPSRLDSSRNSATSRLSFHTAFSPEILTGRLLCRQNSAFVSICNLAAALRVLRVNAASLSFPHKLTTPIHEGDFCHVCC